MIVELFLSNSVPHLINTHALEFYSVLLWEAWEFCNCQASKLVTFCHNIKKKFTRKETFIKWKCKNSYVEKTVKVNFQNLQKLIKNSVALY